MSHDFLAVENTAHVKDMWREEQKNLQRLEPLAHQGRTTVYKIMWHGKHFADKCFYVPENGSFKTEASILAGLAHPNIVPSFCSATDDRSCSIVMELMDEDHFCLLQKKPLDAPFELLEAVDIMLQIAEGMCYLHHNRVIHRDLKPMNILVHCDGRMQKWLTLGSPNFKNQVAHTPARPMIEVLLDGWHQNYLVMQDQHHGESDKPLQYHFKVDIYSFGMVC